MRGQDRPWPGGRDRAEEAAGVGAAQRQRVGVEDGGGVRGEGGVDQRPLALAGPERRAEGDRGDPRVAERIGEVVGAGDAPQHHGGQLGGIHRERAGRGSPA